MCGGCSSPSSQGLPVLCSHVLLHKLAQQGALAGVRVAAEGHRGRPCPLLPVLRADLPDLIQLLEQLLPLLTNPPALQLDLLLAPACGSGQRSQDDWLLVARTRTGRPRLR